MAVNVLSNNLKVDRGLLMLSYENKSSITFEPVPTHGISDFKGYQFTPENGFIVALQQHVPVLRDEIEHDLREGLSEADLEWFKLTDMEVYAPIPSGNEIAGLLAVGPKRSGAVFQQSELDLLQLLAEQTTVALQNARLFRRLETQNENIRKLNVNLQRQNEHLEALDKVKTDFIFYCLSRITHTINPGKRICRSLGRFKQGWVPNRTANL